MYLLITLLSIIWLLDIANLFKEQRVSGRFQLYEFGLKESNALKGILALGIVLCHLQTFCFKPYDYPIVNQFAVFAQVGVFFFISGYGLVAAYHKKGHEYLHGFLRHRLSKVVLPLVLATAIYIVERNIFFTENGGVKSDTPLPFSWFCYVIILYYIAFYGSLKVTKSIGNTIVLLFVLTSACYFIMGKYLHLGDWWYRSTWGFNIGMIVKFFETPIKAQLKRFLIPVMFLVPFGLFCIYAAGHFGVDKEVQAIGISLLLLLFIYTTGFKTSKYFNWLGRYSYEIYLCHPMAIAFYPLWPINGFLGDCIYIISLFIVTMLMAKFLKFISNKIICANM